MILLLWLPVHIIKTPLGAQLVNMREAFVSKESGKRYLGYLAAQKAKLKGERSPKVSRPELVEKYGYDTKFAMHALRLGLQGIEVMTHRRLTLPVAEPDLTTLRRVRSGQTGLADALQLIENTEKRLGELVEACTWVADIDGMNRFMVKAHLEYWRSRGLLTGLPGESSMVATLAGAAH